MNWFRTWISVALLSSASVAPARALVTSDELGSHVIAPGEVRYGARPDGATKLIEYYKTGRRAQVAKLKRSPAMSDSRT